MYGSSLIRRTLSPRASRIAPRQADVIPLPRDDTTPPVMKMNRVILRLSGTLKKNAPALRRHSHTRKNDWCFGDGITTYQNGPGAASPRHEPRQSMRG